MQTCQPAAGLTLRRLPFSPWANQTELWEGHPRLWCLCRRGNSAWQLLAFRQQPVFMEIIPPYSRRSRLLLITARMKTKLSFFCFLSFFFHPLLFPLSADSLELAQQLLALYGIWQCTPALKRYILRANINLEETFALFGQDQKVCDAPEDAHSLYCFRLFYPSKVKLSLCFLFSTPGNDKHGLAWEEDFTLLLLHIGI